MRLAVLSMHTSPLAQPGSGDGGGMNVYVRELAAALARLGVAVEVFTRATHPKEPPVVKVEPNFFVHQVRAGPALPVPKEALFDLVPEWTANVAAVIDSLAARGRRIDAIHANYWLSGVAGHALKHDLEVPLLVTFHTLDRVKAQASPEEISFAEPARRAKAEAETIGCADAVLASCDVEALQLVDLYHADPDRILIVAPGYDRTCFGPGDRSQARRAVGLGQAGSVVLFCGRIQPLKGLGLAVEALSEVRSRQRGLPEADLASLVVIGGPSGPHGCEELARVEKRAEALGLGEALRLVPPQPHQMLSSFYRAANVCVVPSHSESFGLVALEAAACGLPVVASAVGGLTTLVDHERTGFLVEGRDPRDYAVHLFDLLSDPVKAAAMGRAGAAKASLYTWRSAALVFREKALELASSELVACP